MISTLEESQEVEYMMNFNKIVQESIT